MLRRLAESLPRRDRLAIADRGAGRRDPLRLMYAREQ
jgi:hypothetical protein